MTRSCIAGVNDASHGADDAEHAASITEVDEEGDQEDEAGGREAALTLHGMVRRVARLAGETSWTRWSPVPCKRLALRSR